MQRFSMLTICLLAVSTFIATAAHAQNGHFISASDVLVTSGTHAGDLLVLTERMPQFGHIPAIPTSLLVAAAAMPAQCVPCPKPSLALLPT